MVDAYQDPEETEINCDQKSVNDQMMPVSKTKYLNPRYLFINPASDFGREFYQDLLMEMQEQM